MPRPNRDQQIMDAALSVFAERGYDGTRIRHIAERAGVSEGALYSHHKSKESLALALFRQHMTRYSEALAEVADAPGQSVEQRIKGIATRTLEAFDAEPNSVAFIISHQARFIGALPADFPYSIRIVERLIRAGQQDRSVRAGPVRLLAALVFGCIVQPIRTVLEAPRGTISLRSDMASELVAEAAWAAIAARS
jgi:AcrR family transcriptional regulator